MKLDVTCMRYLSKDDYRVLTAVEQGMRNHELVPVELITSIAKLRHGGIIKILSTLLRHKLLAHEQQQYNGYRLSYLGYDILALRTLLSRNVVTGVGSQIGVGKESDIFEATDEEGNELVIKIHRLGRTSFRTVRKNRDYMENKSKASWLYMSRLAAIKEFAFMQALYARDFPTPRPVDQNRHIVVMNRIHGYPLSQVQGDSLTNIPLLFLQSIQILKRLVYYGLIHCDYNEFNLMISSSTGHQATASNLPYDSSSNDPVYDHLIMIDFPQIISITHPNSSEMFQRDLNGVIRYFTHKLKYSLEEIDEKEDKVEAQVHGQEDAEGGVAGVGVAEKKKAPMSEEEKRIRDLIVEELIGKDGEIIQLEEIIESQQKEKREKEQREREERSQKATASGGEGGTEDDDAIGDDIYEEIKRRQYHGGGMNHDDDRTLIEYLAHNREHKAEMMRELMNEGGAEEEDKQDPDHEATVEEVGQLSLQDRSEVEGGEEGSEDEDEAQPIKSQEEIRNALRRLASCPSSPLFSLFLC
jgi:RIO kinase 2